MKKYVLVGTGWRGTMAYLEPMVKEYTAAPLFMDGDAKCRHQWLVEFVREADVSERG